MGAVPAEVVIATFYNFRPDVVREEIPHAWASRPPRRSSRRGSAPPAACCAVSLAMRPRGRTSRRLPAWHAEAAERAADHPEGRPLFAAHASLPWPDDPLLVLWHAQSLLREFRGDGHIAVLTTEGLSGFEALVVHGGTGEVPRRALQSTRRWSDDEWEATAESLRSRGWLAEDGLLTAAGSAHRQQVEDRTDALAVVAYEALGEDGCARLRTLARPLAKAVVESSAFGFRGR